MLDFLFDTTNRSRKRRLKRASQSPLKNYLSGPHPKNSSLIQNTPILSVDFETTGLDAKKDQLLSIGFVEINQLGIQLSSAKHQIIRVDRKLDADNVIVHKITDKEKNNGMPLESAMANLLYHMKGRVLLAHHAKTEVDFIDTNCEALYGIKPTMVVIDTIELAAKRIKQNEQKTTAKYLRLFNLRHSHNLPEYTAHNALYDAISTAELFLAEINKLPKKHRTPLSELRCRI